MQWRIICEGAEEFFRRAAGILLITMVIMSIVCLSRQELLMIAYERGNYYQYIPLLLISVIDTKCIFAHRNSATPYLGLASLQFHLPPHDD